MDEKVVYGFIANYNVLCWTEWSMVQAMRVRCARVLIFYRHLVIDNIWHLQLVPVRIVSMSALHCVLPTSGKFVCPPYDKISLIAM